MIKEAAILQSFLKFMGKKYNNKMNDAVTQAIPGVNPLPLSRPSHTITEEEIRNMLNPPAVKASRVDASNPIFAAEIAQAKSRLKDMYLN